ncbi:amidohydrolase [Streptomyces californicus]
MVCDADGRPTGLLLEEAACELVEPGRAPAHPAGERRASGRRPALDGRRRAHRRPRHGRERDSLALYAGLDAAGDLPLRLRVAPWCRPGVDSDAVRALIGQQGRGGSLWRTEGVKLFMDGTIDNGTAWLERPDCHGESTQTSWPDPAAYTRVIGELHDAGVPTATHAIGDAAVRHALDAVDRAWSAGGPDVRHRIEHIETVPDDTVARFAELGVVASMQPTHCADFTLADHTDNWSRRLGEERASHAWRCRDLYVGARVVLVWTGRSPTSRRWASWRRPATAVPAATSPSRRTAPARRSPPSKRSGA